MSKKYINDAFHHNRAGNVPFKRFQEGIEEAFVDSIFGCVIMYSKILMEIIVKAFVQFNIDSSKV